MQWPLRCLLESLLESSTERRADKVHEEPASSTLALYHVLFGPTMSRVTDLDDSTGSAQGYLPVQAKTRGKIRDGESCHTVGP